MEAFVIYPSQQFDWNFLVIYLLFIQLEQKNMPKQIKEF